MNVLPVSEDHGSTFGVHAPSSGESRVHVSAPAHHDEDDDFAALMNSDKSVREPTRGSFPSDNLPGAPSAPPSSFFESSPSTPRQESHPPAFGDAYQSTARAQTYDDSNSFRSLEEEKQHYLYKIQRLQSRIPGRRVSIDTPLDELKYEYDRLKRQSELSQSVKLQRRLLMGAVTGIEYLNKQFNPLQLHLDGWSETVMDQLEDYDTVFEQLHDKYGGEVQVSPEASLLMMLLGSGFMYHLSNTLFKSVLPSVSDISRQNPDLMAQISNAMSSAMGQKGVAQPGQSNAEMGADLAFQAMQAGPTNQYTNRNASRLDDDISDVNSQMSFEDDSASVSRHVTQNSFAAASSFIPPLNPNGLPPPQSSSMSEVGSDVSSEFSVDSSDLKRVSAKRGRKKKSDNRKGIDINF